MKGTLSLVGKGKKCQDSGARTYEGLGSQTWRVDSESSPENCELAEGASALGKEFVLFNHRGHSHFAIGGAALDPHYASLALHPDTLGQRDLRRRGESKTKGRTGLD